MKIKVGVLIAAHCSPALQLISEIVPGFTMKCKVMLDFNKQHRHGNMLINADLNLMEARRNYPRMY